MRKNSLLLFIILCIYYIALNKHAYSNEISNFKHTYTIDSIEYCIFQIDSINNHYIISAKNRGYNYKIITRKNEYICDSKIQIGKTYSLKIEGVFRKFFPQGGPLGISGYGLDSVTTLKFEEGFVRDFFTTKDLKGLCIVTK